LESIENDSKRLASWLARCDIVTRSWGGRRAQPKGKGSSRRKMS